MRYATEPYSGSEQAYARQGKGRQGKGRLASELERVQWEVRERTVSPRVTIGEILDNGAFLPSVNAINRRSIALALDAIQDKREEGNTIY